MTSIIVERLNGIIGRHVKEAQRGFVRGRFMRDIIRKLRNIMDKVQKEGIPAVFAFFKWRKGI